MTLILRNGPSHFGLNKYSFSIQGTGKKSCTRAIDQVFNVDREIDVILMMDSLCHQNVLNSLSLIIILKQRAGEGFCNNVDRQRLLDKIFSIC